MTDPIVAPSTVPKPITTKQLAYALTKVWDRASRSFYRQNGLSLRSFL